MTCDPVQTLTPPTAKAIQSSPFGANCRSLTHPLWTIQVQAVPLNFATPSTSEPM